MGTETSAADDSQFEAGYSTEPTETPASVDKPEPSAPAENAAPADPLKEFIARFDKFEATQNTLAGHIGGLQRSQKEMRDTLAAASAATKTVSDAPSQAQVKNAVQDPEKWAALRKGYPEWAAATEEYMDAKLATLPAPQALDPAAIDKIVGERTAKVREELIDSRLDEIVDGDWRAEVATPQFNAWLAAQPADVKALADSDKVKDAARMMRLYQASRQATSTPAPVVKPASPEPTNQVSARQKRIAAAVTPRGSGGHATGSTEMDEFEAGYSG